MINVTWNKNINIKYQCWNPANERQHEMWAYKQKLFIIEFMISQQTDIARYIYILFNSNKEQLEKV